MGYGEMIRVQAYALTNLGDYDYEKEDLKYFFPEFRKYEGMCKFHGCDHVHEPGCAVKEALEEGKIHKIRYQNYIEMYEELKNKRRY